VICTIFDNILTRFGVPHGLILQSNNASNFIAKLPKLFCETFGVKQNFSSPYHPQPNSKVEQFGDSLNKAIRILATKQSDWSKHLQAIAMPHRASVTSSTGFSPYEIVFGQPMQLFIDHGLLSDKTNSPSLEAYMRYVAPKLTILHDLVMKNASESAA
jgi:transposase InsO family protein